MTWDVDMLRTAAEAEDPHRRMHAWVAAHALGDVAALLGPTRERLEAEGEVLEAGVQAPLILVPARGEAWLEGRRVARFRRSRLQYRLLEAIAVHGTTWDHQALYEGVWELPWRAAHTDNALHSAIARLRRTVDADVIAIEVGPLGGFRVEPARPVVRWREDGIGYPPPRPPPPARPTVRLGPAPPRLFGRDALIERAESAVDGGRWVSLVGPPGVGKTVLARSVLHRAVASRWPGGRLWVDAVDVTLPTALLGRVRAALGHAPGPMLVVLDNLEQLQDEPSRLDALFDGRPDVVVLATSRRALHTSDEVVLEVPPLDPVASTSLLQERLGRHGAVRPGARALAELARRTHHLPLALEQVARQVHTLGVPRVIDALDPVRSERPEVVLELAIQRSWELLEPGARGALEHLALHPAGLSRDDLSEQMGEDVGGAAEALLAHHLVVEEGEDRPRLVAYVPVQAWVLGYLRRSRRLPELARSQVDRALALVRRPGGTLRLDAHVWRNMDAALDRAIHYTDQPIGELLVFVVDALLHHTDPSTTWLRSDQVLRDFGDRVAPADHCRVLRLRGLHLQLGARYDEARTEYARALDIADAADDDVLRFEVNRLSANLEARFELALGLEHLRRARELAPADAYHQARYDNLAAEVHRLAGDFDAAVRAARRCVRLRRANGEAWSAWNAQHQLAHVLVWAGRLREARMALDDVPHDEAPPRYRANWAAHHALLEAHAGDLEASLAWLRRAREEADALGLGTGHLQLREIGIRIEQGATDSILDALEEAERTYARTADATGLLSCVFLAARLGLDRGRPEEARCALERGQEIQSRTGLVFWPGKRELLEALVELADGGPVDAIRRRLATIQDQARRAGNPGVALRAAAGAALLGVEQGEEPDLEPLHAEAAALGDTRLSELLDATASVVLYRGLGDEAAVRTVLDGLEDGPGALTARCFFARFWVDRMHAALRVG